MGLTGVFAVAALMAVPMTAGASSGSATPYTSTGPGYVCTGTHVDNKAQPPKDAETCITQGQGATPGTYKGDPNANIPPFGEVGWLSDYYTSPVVATSFTLQIIDNSDGTQTWNVVAYYVGQSS